MKCKLLRLCVVAILHVLVSAVSTIAIVAPVYGQGAPPTIIYVSSAPSGACSSAYLPTRYLVTNGNWYGCVGGTWQVINGGGSGLVDCSETSGTMTCPGGFSAGAATAGAVSLREATANGTKYVRIQAQDAITTSYVLKPPAVPPAVGQVQIQGTPSGSPSTSVAAWGDVVKTGTTNANGYFDWTLGAAPGNPAAGDIRLYPKTGSTLCARDSAGTETCYGSGGGSSTKTYTFQGINQGDVPAWNVNYRTLTNMVFSTLDASNLRSLLTVTANTTGGDLWTITPVTTTNPTVGFIVSARSTDATNAGSMALAYACVPSGDSVNNPSYTSLTALSLTTIDPDSEVFQSSQAVTCTGTESAPADLYVKWTPTAPSGGTLSLIKLMLIY